MDKGIMGNKDLVGAVNGVLMVCVCGKHNNGSVPIRNLIGANVCIHYVDEKDDIIKRWQPITDIEEVREAVGVLTQGNQSGGTTKQSGTFFPTPNSGLMPVEKHKRYSAFIEWLDAMGWLKEFADGQENAIFEWFEKTFEPYLKGGE